MVNREAVTQTSAWVEPKTQQAAYVNSTMNDVKHESEVGNAGDFNVWPIKV